MKKFLTCLLAFVLVLAMVLPMASCGDTPEETTTAAKEETTAPKNETTAPEETTKAPETNAPETTAPETNAPETTAPETNATEGTDATEGTEATETTGTEGTEGTEATEETTELVIPEDFTAYEEPVVNPEGIEFPLPPAEGYTYKDAVVTLAANWNQHTYQTSDDSYPISFITTGLYGFFFNDEVVYSADKDPYAGYVIAPEMAAAMPIDATGRIKVTMPKYGIPTEATKGYAYVIKLNPDAKWQDGTPINADTYVYSMKQLLDPVLMNYRATDYFDGAFAIANARNYYYQGKTSYLANSEELGLADLVKGEDGVYYNPANGNKFYIGVDYNLAYFDGQYSLADYVNDYGDQYFSTTHWEALAALANEDGVVALTDETYPMILDVITGNANWGEDESYMHNYFLEGKYYEDNYDFSNVGIFKSGDYEITIVLEKSLTGFNLLYNLTGNWIVYESLYEAGKTQIEDTDAWTNTYNSSVETTMSYGPYKLAEFQSGKYMKFVRNENWFGYTDNKHGFIDPQTEEACSMYMTSDIYCQVVEEAETRKLMFLKGELMGYGLQAADFAEYRTSDRAYVTPSETIYFLIFNGYLNAIQAREAAEGFDKTTTDIETITLNSFRRAFAVTYDKEAFATTISPSRSGGYGIIGSSYIYDPETGARYRDTDQAKKALCEFYSVDVSKYESLDAAVDSITGYDPETAKALFTEAFHDAIEAGYITDADNDGKSDQTVKIEYASSATSTFIQDTLAYLNQKLAEVLVGTPFEGKIEIYESAPLGTKWSENIKAGQSDTVLGGWNGSALDPFGLTDLYTNPAYQYDAAWFNAASVNLTMTIAGEEITMNLKQWSDALNGTAVTVGEGDAAATYNFGEGMADIDTRLDILAAIETEVLKTYNYIPMLQDGSVALLSKQVYYVVEEYNPIMGRGGITYMGYNYDNDAWAAYVASEGGQVKY